MTEGPLPSRRIGIRLMKHDGVALRLVPPIEPKPNAVKEFIRLE